MGLSVTQSKAAKEALKTRSMYDNYDNLVSVIKYDDNQRVDYILKTRSNIAGENLQTDRYNQVQVDLQSPQDVTAESARLRARVYKNENSKVYETGFIFWKGNANDTVLNKPRVGDVFGVPNVFKGNMSKTITDLEDNSTYNYRAFVRHEYGTNYSVVGEFTTIDFNSIFSIIGNRFSGPEDLTVSLSAINAGFGPYTYAWNMTGGNIGFKYSLDSITVSLSGAGYSPSVNRYILNTINVSQSGAGYNKAGAFNVMVNGVSASGLTPQFGFNSSTGTFGITSVLVSQPLSGYETSTLLITFSAADISTITQIASGTGSISTYQIPRETIVLIDGTYQPSLSVRIFQDENTGVYGVSAVHFLTGPLSGYTTSSRSYILSTNGPVDQAATLSLNTSFIILNADYYTRTITHTYSAVGNFNPIVYALFGDQIQKSATRLIRVTGGTNFSSQWTNVLAAYGNNIAAAYDFRNFNGLTTSSNLNEFPLAFWNFESTSQGPIGLQNTSSILIDSASPWNDSVGGYLSIAGYVPVGGYTNHPIFGYPIQQLNYSGFYGPGLTTGTTAARFDSSVIVPVGGYKTQFMIGWSPFYCFNFRQPFTVSMWVNMEKFDVPGTKLFTVRTFNNREFSITQSTTALNIFRNVFLSDVMAGYWIGGYGPPEPLAGYYNGFPVLSTTNPSDMLVPQQWNHLVVTRTPDHTYKYYLNGNLKLQRTTLTPLDPGNTWATGRLGSNWQTPVGGYDQFDVGAGAFSGIGGYCYISIGDALVTQSLASAPSGRIDSVGIWGKALSQEEVGLLYNGGQGTDDFGYLTPIVGPKLWLGGITGNTAGYPTTFNFGDLGIRPSTTADNLWNYVSLKIDGDGTNYSTNIADSSLNSVFLSGDGNAYVTTDIKKFGTGAISFSGGCLQTPASANHAWFGYEDFTIEWWDNLQGDEFFYPIMFYGGTGWSYPSTYGGGAHKITKPGFGMLYRPIYGGNSADGLTIVWTDQYSGWFNNSVSIPITGPMSIGGYKGRWVHNAVQRRRISPPGLSDQVNWSWYRNGGLAGYTTQYSFQGFGSYIDRIGGYIEDTGHATGKKITADGLIGAGDLGGYYYDYNNVKRIYFNGYIDDLRITKGVARYTSNFTVTTAYPSEFGDMEGTQFKLVPNNVAYAASKEANYGVGGYTRDTVQVTYPHTLVFVGRVDGASKDSIIYQGIQPRLNARFFSGVQPGQGIYSESKVWAGLYPDNGTEAVNYGNVQPIAGYDRGGTYPGGYYRSSYLPIGGYDSEWMYLAYSFLGPNYNNNIRYYLRTPSISGTGIIGGYSSPSNFLGMPMFGVGGYSFNIPTTPINNFAGNVRLGVYINAAFPELTDMLTLYKEITAGPANDLKFDK